MRARPAEVPAAEVPAAEVPASQALASSAGGGAGSGSIRVLVAELARSPLYLALFAVVSAVVSLLYSLLLPFEYTQRFSLLNWQFLTGRLLVWSLVLGVGMGTVVAVQVNATRRIVAARGSALGGFALIGALLPSLLCCSPAIPTLLAFVGVSGVGLYSTTGTLQHFFATHQNEFLSASLVLLVTSAWWGLRRTARSTCLGDEGCDLGAPPRRRERGEPQHSWQSGALGEGASR